MSWRSLYGEMPEWLVIQRADAEAEQDRTPTSYDLDAIAEEERIREATNGKTESR